MADSAMWRGRPILAPEHSAELEARAAVRELADGVPARQAEHEAHAAYLQGHMKRAAAHHLAAIRAAHTAGDMTEAARHSLRYGVIAKALGYDPQGEPPEEIAALSRDPAHTKVFRFAPHEADALLLNHLLGQRGTNIAKAEGEIPIAGVELPARGDVRVHDFSHFLSDERRQAGERIEVLEGPRSATAHLIREEGGRRVPLTCVAKGEDGVEVIAGAPAADVLAAAGLALGLRGAAGAAAAVQRLRATEEPLAKALRYDPPEGIAHLPGADTISNADWERTPDLATKKAHMESLGATYLGRDGATFGFNMRGTTEHAHEAARLGHDVHYRGTEDGGAHVWRVGPRRMNIRIVGARPMGPMTPEQKRKQAKLAAALGAALDARPAIDAGAPRVAPKLAN